MFTTFANIFVGPHYIKETDENTKNSQTKVKARPIHQFALVADILIGLGLIALYVASGRMNMGFSPDTRMLILGVGATYTFASLLCLAIRIKLYCCPQRFLKPPITEEFTKKITGNA